MKIKIFRINKDNPVPLYMSSGASGLDLYASIEQPVVLNPGLYCTIPTGIIIAIPHGYEGQVRPRSGLAMNHGITILNSPGTIDSDYRGEIKVILINSGSDIFTITNGMRVAQLIINRVIHASLTEVKHINEIEQTERNDSGFGHTGF